MFAKLCEDRRLKVLALVGAFPSTLEFGSITNLQGLERVLIAAWPSFGKEEVTLLSGLPKLSSLAIFGTGVSNADTNILKHSSSLTNIDFIQSRALTSTLPAESK